MKMKRPGSLRYISSVDKIAFLIMNECEILLHMALPQG